jgi:[protein-PII] uridylyltransferase
MLYLLWLMGIAIIRKMNTMQFNEPEVVKKAFAATKPGGAQSWQERRDDLRKRLGENPPAGFETDEIEAHFTGMPSHYWERVTEPDLIWGLEATHGFLNLLAAAKAPPTMPFMDYCPEPGTHLTRVMLCTWDRQGLLAKAAASFSAVRLSIQRAEVFTRADNVVLDLFRVTNADAGEAVSAAQMQNMVSLLDGALSEPPRFASVWACSRHKYLADHDPLPPRIIIDNQASRLSTLVQIEAFDRLGLLYDILQAIAESGFNVLQAAIETEGVSARDTIHVVDAQGKKLTSPTQLQNLKKQLETALNR